MRTIDHIRLEHRDAVLRNDVPTLRLLLDELAGQTDAVARALWLNTSGQIHRITGDPDRALADFEAALQICRDTDDASGIASNLGNIALIHEGCGRLEQTLSCLHQAVEAADQAGSTPMRASLLNNLGSFLYQCSDYPSALHYLELAEPIYDAASDNLGLARVIGNKGMIHHAMFDLDRATACYERSRQIHLAAGNHLDAAIAASNLAMIVIQQGRPTDGLHLLQGALQVRRELGNPDGIAMTLSKIVSTLLDLDRIPEATTHIAELDAIDVRNPALVVQRLQLNARLAASGEALEESRSLLLKAVQLASDHQLKSQLSDLHRDLRELSYRRRDLDGYVHHNGQHVRIQDELKGQEITRKLAAIEVQQRIDEERAEKEKRQDLLYGTLPPSVADRLLRGESVNDEFPMVAVLFMDIVGFTTLSSTKSAAQVVELLGPMFTTCDRIAQEHHVVKIKTIGDCYMAVAFPVEHNNGIEPNVAVRMARTARAMYRAVRSLPDVDVRIGLNAGPIVAGVIGTERLQYDVWGNTVNVASRMESTGDPGTIHVSEDFANELRRGLSASATTTAVHPSEQESLAAALTIRGEITVKGKGVMNTYWLDVGAHESLEGVQHLGPVLS